MDSDVRDGVTFTNLDQALFDGAGVTKGELVDYLDAIADRMVKTLTGRPLSVVRARPGQPPFMQKNVPKSAPPWFQTVSLWAETSQREVAYALCNDRRSLLWLGNQRAVEYHPALVRADSPGHLTHLVIDLDPPTGAAFSAVVAVAHLVRQVLSEAGLDGVAKTSGAKGLHIFVPIDDEVSTEDTAAALRAIAAQVEQLDPTIATTAFMKEDRENKVFVDSTRSGNATVASVYSPRARPGLPVSFPLRWDQLDVVTPTDFTIRTAVGILGDSDPWASLMPPNQSVPHHLIEAGRAIPVPRVAAMHEGKRRANSGKRNAD